MQPENNPKSLSRDEALALLKYMEHHNAIMQKNCLKPQLHSQKTNPN